MSKYTVYGSPQFDEYIDTVMQQISIRFQASIDTTSVSALILGGGYGRGEGGTLVQPSSHDSSVLQERLYNDLDLFVISPKIPSYRAKQLNSSLLKLHHELSEEYGIDVDFSDLKPISFLPKAPFTLMWYDLKCAHRTIYGRQNVLKYLPNWKPENIPVMEALKLMLNRGMGLFFALQYLETGKHIDEFDFINRNIYKAYQAIGEAILISEGRYHWSNLERIERIQVTKLSNYTSHTELEQRFLEAMQFKLKPQINPQDQSVLSFRLAEAITIYKEIYYSLWAKYILNHPMAEKRKYSGQPFSDYTGYLACLSDINFGDSGFRSIAKNIYLNLRDSKTISSPLALNLRYPRYRLFYALPWLLFNEDIDPGLICSTLGMPLEAEPQALKERFIQLWRKYN